jgi:hypothetical protein
VDGALLRDKSRMHSVKPILPIYPSHPNFAGANPTGRWFCEEKACALWAADIWVAVWKLKNGLF